MKASLAVALTLGAAHTASATNASVRVYTNTNVDDNHRFFGQFAPGVIDSVYWCCNQYKFTDKGAFGGLRRLKPLQANLDAFRGVFKQNWVVGKVEEAFIKSAAAFDSDFMKEQFASAAAAAQQHGIDGYLVDFEPKRDYSEAMSHNYMLFLKAFKSAMPANVGVGMNVAGWGILNRFEEYAAANLTVYTSMSNTYFGSHVSQNIASLKAEVAALPKEAIRVGIGSELTAYPPTLKMHNYKWTAPALTAMLNALWDLDIPRVDVWRRDIDVKGLNTTAFMIDGLTAFKNGVVAQPDVLTERAPARRASTGAFSVSAGIFAFCAAGFALLLIGKLKRKPVAVVHGGAGHDEDTESADDDEELVHGPGGASVEGGDGAGAVVDEDQGGGAAGAEVLCVDRGVDSVVAVDVRVDV